MEELVEVYEANGDRVKVEFFEAKKGELMHMAEQVFNKRHAAEGLTVDIKNFNVAVTVLSVHTPDGEPIEFGADQ